MTTTTGATTILVVDDEEGLRKVAMAMLRRLGYDVLEARDGPSALKVLGQDGIVVDLVFSDVVLPSGMDGFALAQELHRRYPHIKILLTSGFPGKIPDTGSNDGIGFTVLRKPYDMADLAAAVRTALDQ